MKLKGCTFEKWAREKHPGADLSDGLTASRLKIAYHRWKSQRESSLKFYRKNKEYWRRYNERRH